MPAGIHEGEEGSKRAVRLALHHPRGVHRLGCLLQPVTSSRHVRHVATGPRQCAMYVKDALQAYSRLLAACSRSGPFPVKGPMQDTDGSQGTDLSNVGE